VVVVTHIKYFDPRGCYGSHTNSLIMRFSMTVAIFGV